MSIAQNIQTLSNSKTSIINALIDKGVTNASEHGFTDFADDILNIQNSYSSIDEGKVVSNGNLVVQTIYPTTITESGTYDTTLNNSVTVESGDAELTQFLLDSTIANASGGASATGSSIKSASGNGVWRMRSLIQSTSSYIEPKIKWLKNKIITASFKAAYDTNSASTYTTVYLGIYNTSELLYETKIGDRTKSTSSSYRRTFDIDMSTTYGNLIENYPDCFLRLRIYTEWLSAFGASGTIIMYNSDGTVSFS